MTKRASPHESAPAIILTLFALLAVAVPAEIVAQTSQGRWSGIARVDSPACGIDLTLSGEVRGDLLRGQIQFIPGAPMFDWSITRDGVVHGGGMSGRIAGDRLSGTWQRLEKGRMCLYRVEMLRR